jgi:peptide/nickel transport system substrate-binding protein
MRRTHFQLIVISSTLLATVATGAIRPRYGGTLHVQMQGAILSLDPADASQPETLLRRNVLGLIFDTLVKLDGRGQAEPGLASSWQSDPGGQSWQFTLRPGVRFSDGTSMTPEIVAASLTRSNPGWRISAQETGILIQLDIGTSNLPAELALTRNSITKPPSEKGLGTGPFSPTEWDPGKKLVVTARDDYWGGRPFLDAVEIGMQKNLHDETVAYELGQSQVIEIPPEQAHHGSESRELRTSQPFELVALLFTREAQSLEESKQRKVLSLSIDRDQLNRVVLQNGGEPTGALLPNWLTGYGFLFPPGPDVAKAQQLRAELPVAHAWTLGFDSSDSLARVIADRIVLNASDAGLRLQVSNQGTPDARLVRVPLASLDPDTALTQVAEFLQLPAPRFLGHTADDLYHAENALLQSQRIIPLLHLRMAWAVSKTVRNWENTEGGIWDVPDLWLAPGKP